MTSERATCWSVTINNPNESDEEDISLARQSGWKVLGQLEKGESGTLHYQLCVKTPQVRFSAVRKRFSRAHIEIARSPHALEEYVGKELSRVGALPAQQDKYPSLSKYWELVTNELNDQTKDGLDYVMLEEGVVKFYRDTQQSIYIKKPLHFLDYATRKLILKGYVVEGIGANPNTRSQWNLFHSEIILRCIANEKNVDSEHKQNGDDANSIGSSPPGELPGTRGTQGNTVS